MERSWADQIDRSHRAKRKQTGARAELEARTRAKLLRPEVSVPKISICRKISGPSWDSGRSGAFKVLKVVTPHDRAIRERDGDLDGILKKGGRSGFRALREFVLDARTKGKTQKLQASLRRLAQDAATIDDILLIGGLRITFLFRDDVKAAWTELLSATRRKLDAGGKDVGRALVGLL